MCGTDPEQPLTTAAEELDDLLIYSMMIVQWLILSSSQLAIRGVSVV